MPFIFYFSVMGGGFLKTLVVWRMDCFSANLLPLQTWTEDKLRECFGKDFLFFNFDYSYSQEENYVLIFHWCQEAQEQVP